MKRYLICVIALILLPVCGLAQTGLPPFSSLDQMGLEVANNQDLNVVLSIPIASSPGRGINLNFSIVYNSLNWAPGGGAWNPAFTTNPSAQWGWMLNFSGGQTTYKTTSTQGTCGHIEGDTGATFTTEYSQYQYVDPYGTAHMFNVWWKDVYSECTGQDTYSGVFTGYIDGYYISIGSTTGSILSVLGPGGINVTSPGTTVDINGNYMSSSNVGGGETDWTDSAGRVALKIITGSSSIQYKVLAPTPANTYETTTLYLQTLPVKTNFGCSGVIEYTGTATVPQSLVLPNGPTYTFTYEPTPGNSGYYTARLQRVKVPMGGYHEFDYTGSHDGINCADGTTLGMNSVVDDGTNPSATWNYVRNTTNLTTTITTPKLADTLQANDVVVTFNSSGQETSRKIYANSPGTGTPLRTINTTWAGNGTPATQVTILEDGATQSEIATTYDSNDNLDTVSEYNWGSGAPGSIFRTTTYTYQTSTNYTNQNVNNLVTSKQVKDGSGTVQYLQNITYDGVAITSANCETGALQHQDSGYPCTFNYRGNPTQINTYLAPGTQGGPVTKNFTYDWFGNLITAQLNCCQNKTWAYSSTTQYSEPDSVTSGTSPTTLTTSYTYYSPTGQVNTATDPNNLVTTVQYDLYRRPTSVSQSIGSTNGASASMSYNDTSFSSTVKTIINSSSSIQQITALDGLGRSNLSTTEDASNNVYSKVSTVYDLAGRVYQSSNPYSTSASYWTSTAFDALGRPTSVTLPDNSAATYSYVTNTTTIADPATIKRASVMDPAGRLVTTWEPDPTSNNTLTLQTSYSYNVLDELTLITQGSQTRTYVYDALGRLNSATTPEAGTICMGTFSGTTCQSNGYDSFDNLLYRTDARGVVTSYGYDTLNRLTSVSYNVSGATGVPATSPLAYSYGISSSCNSAHGAGCVGQLITMSDGVGSENYTYNNLEQMTQLQKVISGTTYSSSYAYNQGGELVSLTYPSGHVVQQSVDGVGRLCEVATTTTGCATSGSPFATALGYNAASQMTNLKYGNGIYASFGFSNDRLQLTCIDYSTTNRGLNNCSHDSTTKFGLSYSYPTTPNNNGLIAGIADSVDNGRSATYTYDSLYRLVTAATTGSTNYPAWGLKETYDRYGNRSAQTAISGCVAPMTCPQPSVAISATTNRLVGSPYSYDASGNMTNDGINTIVYDAENHVVSSSGSGGSGTYTYDGNGQRIKKIGGGNTIISLFYGTQVLDEYYNGGSAPTNEYIYAGNLLVASIQSGATDYWHNDHLSPRVRTDSSGNVADQRGTFPFGETWYTPSSAAPWVFTTYYRDVEADGNDYAQARTYVGGLGRFSSPDSIAGSISDPQSLNRYSYVRNMPVMLTDPFGTCPAVVQDVDPNQSRDPKNGGPSANDSSNGSYATPEAPQQGSCPGAPPWYYTSGGGGGDGGGGGGGGVGSLDGGYNGDDSGMGMGSPLGYGGGIGSQFDVLGLALSPTGSYTYTATVNNEPVLMTGYLYGNSDLLELLSGDPDDDSSPSWKRLQTIIEKARTATYIALLSDPNCLSFLNGGLSALINTPIVPTGYSGAGSGAATYQNPVLTGTGSSFQININSSSGFFQPGGSYQMYNGGPPLGGGSPRLQAAVLLHEIGHIMGSLQPDGAPPNVNMAMETKNNQAIQTNCKNALSSLSNTAPK